MKPRPMTNLGSIGGAPDPTTAPEVATGVRKLHADQGYSQANQPVALRRGVNSDGGQLGLYYPLEMLPTLLHGKGLQVLW